MIKFFLGSPFFPLGIMLILSGVMEMKVIKRAKTLNLFYQPSKSPLHIITIPLFAILLLSQGDNNMQRSLLCITVICAYFLKKICFRERFDVLSQSNPRDEDLKRTLVSWFRRNNNIDKAYCLASSCGNVILQIDTFEDLTIQEIEEIVTLVGDCGYFKVRLLPPAKKKSKTMLQGLIFQKSEL